MILNKLVIHFDDPISHGLLLILVHILLTKELSIFLFSCLTANKKQFIRYYEYYETVYEGNGQNLFWSIKNQKRFLIN